VKTTWGWGEGAGGIPLAKTEKPAGECLKNLDETAGEG